MTFRQCLQILILSSFLIEGNCQVAALKNFLIEDGLPTTEIYDIEYDTLNRIWFTSDRGVSMYDGYEFTNYGKEDGLSDNTNFEIIKDPSGRLWFCAYNGTITYYENGEFHIPSINEELKSILRSKWIEQIIFISDTNYILVPYRNSTGSPGKEGWNTFIEYDLANETVNLLEIDSFKLLQNSTEIMYSNEYNLYFNNRSNIFFKGSINGSITPIVENTNVINKDFPIVLAMGDSVLKKIVLSERTIEAEIIDSMLYICSSDGLLVYDLNNYERINEVLKGNVITKILKGPYGNYWVSTHNNGVYYFPSLDVKEFSAYPSKLVPMNLEIFNNHLILCGAHGAGLCIFDQELEMVFDHTDSNDVFYPAMVKDEGSIKLSNFSKLSWDKDQFKIEKNSVKKSANAKNEVFRQVVKVGNYWVCSTSHILYKIEIQNKPIIKSRISIKDNIESICVDANGEIFVSTTSEIIRIDDIDSGKYTSLKNYNKLYSTRLSSMKMVSSNNGSGIIMGTLGSGLLYKSTNSNVPMIFDKKDGLSSNFINTLFVENDSILWVGSNLGLDRIEYRLEEDKFTIHDIENISRLNGIMSQYVSDIVKWNDNMWVLTKNGINYFNYDNLNRNISFPYLYFKQLELGEDTITSFDESYTFDHEDNDITISYNGIYYNKNTLIPFFKTCLLNEKNDTNWVYTNAREGHFNDLNSGSYTFLVDACNFEGEYIGNPISLNFTIEKHFTETFWFKLISLFLLFMLVYLWLKWREKTFLQTVKQNEALQNAKFRIKAAELNVLRNQMNPHFIYNTLNSIQHYIFNGNLEEANYFLSKFSLLMRSSLNLSKLDYINIETEIDFLTNYLELERMRFDEGFEFNIILEDDRLKQAMIPPLLIQPLMENSIKHGFVKMNYVDYELKLEISNSDHYIEMKVTDNGIGYKQSNNSSEESNALNILRNRLLIINQDAELDSSFEILNITSKNRTGTVAIIKLAIKN